ncbi:MAG: hypothetical protein V3U96_04140 [Paracoccaceae bacterium]
MSKLLAISAAGFLSACGGTHYIESGTFRSGTGSEPVKLAQVDTQNNSVTITKNGHQTARYAGTPLPAAQWHTGCQTNTSSETVETWALTRVSGETDDIRFMAASCADPGVVLFGENRTVPFQFLVN